VGVIQKSVGWFSSPERLNQTLVSIESYHEFHGHEDTAYYLLLCVKDRWEIPDELPDYVSVVFPEEMASAYSDHIESYGVIGGFSRCLIADYMLDRHQKVMVFDGDTEFFGGMDDLWEELEDHNAIVTPHRTTPPPLDGNQFNQETLVFWGNYNSGFTAFSRSMETIRFMKWWTLISLHAPEVNLHIGHVSEQGWLRFICDYLSDTLVLRDDGVNFAYWRYDRSDMLRDMNGRWLVGNTPLRMFHYCRFDPVNLAASMETHQNRAKCSPVMLEFLARYRAKLFPVEQVPQQV
jgi:hypothetical protein